MNLDLSFHATGIGTLPHTDEHEAFQLIRREFPSIPFWPQLPNRSFREGMVIQYSEGFPSFKYDEGHQRFWIDTGAGISSNVLYFNVAAAESIIIATPEPTSITDAYALIKVLATKFQKKNILSRSAQLMLKERVTMLQ
jgi:hypothetical protein